MKLNVIKALYLIFRIIRFLSGISCHEMVEHYFTACIFACCSLIFTISIVDDDGFCGLLAHFKDTVPPTGRKAGLALLYCRHLLGTSSRISSVSLVPCRFVLQKKAFIAILHYLPSFVKSLVSSGICQLRILLGRPLPCKSLLQTYDIFRFKLSSPFVNSTTKFSKNTTGDIAYNGTKTVNDLFVFDIYDLTKKSCSCTDKSNPHLVPTAYMTRIQAAPCPFPFPAVSHFAFYFFPLSLLITF